MIAVSGISFTQRPTSHRLTTPFTPAQLTEQPVCQSALTVPRPDRMRFGTFTPAEEADPTLSIPQGTMDYLTAVRRENRTPQGTDLRRLEPRFQPELQRVYNDVNGVYSGALKGSQLLKGLVSGEHSTPKTRYMTALALSNGCPSGNTARLLRWYVNEVDTLTQHQPMPVYSDLVGLRVITSVVSAWPPELRKPMMKDLLKRPDTLVGNELKQRFVTPPKAVKETTGKPGPFRLNGLVVSKPAQYVPADVTPFEQTFGYGEQRVILAQWLLKAMAHPPAPMAKCRNDVSPKPGTTFMYNSPQLHEAITRFALRHNGQGDDVRHHKSLDWFTDHLLAYDTQRLLANKLGIPNSRFVDMSDGIDTTDLKKRWEAGWALQLAIAFGVIKDNTVKSTLFDALLAHQETQSPTAGIAKQVVSIIMKDKTPVDELVKQLQQLEKAG